jgi:hypothetical protein
MRKNQSVTLFIPVTNLDAIWKGDASPLPPNQTYNLIIDYPLDKPASFKIRTGKNGMTFLSLLNKIGIYYNKIYENEDKYGIWGHDIDDLSLQGVDINHKNKTINLSLGS